MYVGYYIFMNMIYIIFVGLGDFLCLLKYFLLFKYIILLVENIYSLF